MRAKDPYQFPEGTFVRSVRSNLVYKIIRHRNGMSDLLNIKSGFMEKWNSYNNQHFISADFVSLGVQTLYYAN